MRSTRLLFAMLVIALAGCAAPRATFPGHERAVVWTAMVAVANAPTYRDEDPRRRWHVVQNDVWPDPHAGTIEIHRMLERSLKLARLQEDRQRRELLLAVRFLPIDDEDPDAPPTAEMRARNNIWIPAQLRNEATRYFGQVRELLESR